MPDLDHDETDMAGQAKSASIKKLRCGGPPSMDSQDAEDKATSAQKQFMAAIECVSDGFALFDADDRMVFCNTRFTEMNPDLAPKLVPGVSFEKLLRDNISANRILDALGGEEAFIRRRMEQHRNPSGPLVQQRRDGRWLELREERTPEGSTFLVNTDITERKRAEETLRKREAQLRGIMDNAPIEIVLKDTEGHYVLTNAQWQENYNLTDEEAKGKTLHDFFPEEFAKPLSAHEREVMETGEAAAYEDKFPQSDGVHDFLTVMFPIRDTAGEVVNFGAMAVDITDQKRAEEALRESEARLSKATKMAKIGYWVWDEIEDKAIYCSEEMAKMYGVASGEDLAAILCSHAADLEWIHPEDREYFNQAVEKSNATKGGFDFEYRIINSEGEIRHVHVIEELIIDQHGEIIRSNGVVHDITDQKRVEEEIRKLNAELEQRVEERTADLRAAQAELMRQERMATLGQLTATVSHELRNPLGVIQSSNFVVRDNLKDCGPRVRRSLDRIERSVIRCDRIIDELLDYTRIQQLEPEPTPIDTWLDGVLEEQTRHTDITLRRELGLPGVKVFLDHDRFRRAVINVFDNACQAMTGEVGPEAADADNAVLSVTTQRKNGRVEVIFEDRGPGIPADVLPRIFEPMFSTKGFGVGLGLPVVKQIMEQHGGGIEIETAEGHGTKVCLWLPTS